MSIKDKFEIKPIPKKQTHYWLKKKHYAHSIPSIMHSFGLYNKHLVGVCTYGSPARLMNNGGCIFDYKYKVYTVELNRLVVEEGLPDNTLSYFVAGTLKKMPMPSCIVSYSDIGQGHHGYIYQATNWIYTGVATQSGGYTYLIDGEWMHPRTIVSKFGTREHDKITEMFPNVEYKRISRKHRYFYFVGDKNEKSHMRSLLKYPVLPYPKGNNDRYEMQEKTISQDALF
jgi:hypothetical protein